MDKKYEENSWQKGKRRLVKNLALIACVSRDGGLGKGNELLWHIPEDMKFFRKTTLHHPVIMGGKTFRSIGKVLPGRENAVLSRQQPEGDSVVWLKDIVELRRFLAQDDGLKFIIGGASLYQMFVSEADMIYLTEVDSTKPADVFFPDFDRSQYQKKTLQTGEYDGVKYQIVEYRR